MLKNLMILPSIDADNIRMVRIPEGYQAQEAYRKVTGLIAKVEDNNPDYSWDDIASILEEYGFVEVEFLLGPAIDY